MSDRLNILLLLCVLRPFSAFAIRSRLCLAALVSEPLILFAPAATTAQEPAPSGLEAAAALEKAVVDAIAKAEKSVVAIARVRKDGSDPAVPRDVDQPRLPPPVPEVSDPTDPDFVPSEFGTGVVIDAKGLIVTNYHVLGDTKTADF